MRERNPASYVTDPATGAGLKHYLAAMLLVGCALAGAGRVLDRAASIDAPSETDDAILVDLPPLEAGTHPQGDDAPTQPASPEAAAAATPPQQHLEPPPEAPKPASVATAKTAPPQPAPAAAPQAAHQAGDPQAASAPDANAEAEDEETRRASAHRITLWQKALMARLQATRRGLPHHASLAGLVEIAFVIDRDGHLVSERVAKGSGSAAADATALTLVRLAAPYPAPPRDADAAHLSFVVPISFRR